MSTDDHSADDPLDEDRPLKVDDPQNYNQARRLKTIHQARDDVRKALSNVSNGRAPRDEHERTRTKLAHSVAAYGHELLPLMKQTGWEHSYEDVDYIPFHNVTDYIARMGDVRHFSDHDAPYTPVPVSMRVYSALNTFLAEIGLGAELDEGNDEWEI